jgi:hypothetical protein
MRINQDNNIYNAPDASFLLVQEDSFSRLEEGEIITGVVSKNGSSPMIRFDEIDKEIPASADAYRYSPVGEKHAFRVEKNNGRLSLKDLGVCNDDVQTGAPVTDPRDTSLIQLTNDFRETMKDIESGETHTNGSITEEEANEIAAEGFDLEDFKAERLMRALDRIRSNREDKSESLDRQIETLREDKKAVKRQSARNAANRYDDTVRMADRLFSDSPAATPVSVNVYSPATDITAGAAARITYDYNTHVSYTSPSSNPADSGATPSVPDESTVAETKTDYTPDSYITPSSNPADSGATPSVPGARTGEETKIDNTLVLDISPFSDPADSGTTPSVPRGSTVEENTVMDNTVSSLYVPNESTVKGTAAEITAVNGTWKEVTFRIHIEEQRLRMSGTGSKAALELGATVDFVSTEERIASLRRLLTDHIENLSREWDIDTGAQDGFFSHEVTARIAVDTLVTAADIADAPASFYRTSISFGTSITFEKLGAAAVAEEASVTRSVLTMSAIASYDAGATEIRADLGDSIRKAFNHIDEVLTENDLPVTDANKRAVRILASAGMDVTAESIENVKYYDAKVMEVVNRMTPAAVLSLIKRGINPLKESIDSLTDLLDEDPEQSPLSREEQISSFLVNLEEKGDISETERSAYINIYRLLYTISRDDYAAIASVLADGRDMTLKNLLAAQRSRRDSGMDIKIDDSTSVVHSDIVNSISENLEAAFAYNKRLTNEILSETDPDVTDRALKGSAEDNRYEELTLEEVAFKMRQAKEEHTASPAKARELVRFVMSSSPEYRRFLKKIGVRDSVKNTMALIDGLYGDNLSIPAGDSASLASAMESKETLDTYASNRLAEAEEQTRDDIFPAEGAPAQAPTGVLSALSRYDLLREFTKKEHYRFSLDNGSGSSINLTFIHDRSNAGTVSIHIADEKLVTTAALSVRNTPNNPSARAVIYGSITCESIEEIRGTEGLLKVYTARMEGKGIDASGITVRSGGLGTLQQLTDLTGLVPEGYSPPDTGGPASSGTLYEAARVFVEIWTAPQSP